MSERVSRTFSRALACITLGHTCFCGPFSAGQSAQAPPLLSSDISTPSARIERREEARKALAAKFPGHTSEVSHDGESVFYRKAGASTAIKTPLKIEVPSAVSRWKTKVTKEKAWQEKTAEDPAFSVALKSFARVQEIAMLGDIPYAVVESPRQGTLARELAARPRSILNAETPLRSLIHALIGLTKGIEAIHRQGGVHGEIDPQTIGLIVEGEAEDLRFQFVDSGRVESGPEAGRELGAKEDLPALGKLITLLLNATLNRMPAELSASFPDQGGTEPIEMRAWLDEGMARQKLEMLAKKLEALQVSNATTAVEELTAIEKTVRP